MRKMNIALLDLENNNYPNLALTKLSAWHKSMGDNVEWYDPLFSRPDKLYVSKIFNFTPDCEYIPDCEVEYGGTGYDVSKKLPQDIENICPDYDLYGLNYSLGFLTRGCIRKCSWCIVPKKEGGMQIVNDITDIAKHRKVVLMDNNILAEREFAIDQFKKIAKMNLKIDFNQGLDARLIDDEIAHYMGKCIWEKIRLSCDTVEMIPHLKQAITILRKNNCTPRSYFVYVLVKDIDDALERIDFLVKEKCDPFAQPFRDLDGDGLVHDKVLKKFARWVNHKAIFNTVKWEDYK